MSTLAVLVIDLLVHLTFPPAGGHDSEESAALEMSCWQSLLNDLSPAEKGNVRAVVSQKVEWLRSLTHRSENLDAALSALEAFLRDELF